VTLAASLPHEVSAAVWSAFHAAPENMVAEILDGELVLLPRPSRRHGHSAMRLSKRLGPYHDPEGDDPGGWLFLPEPELRLGPRPDVLVPDLAGWRLERVSEDFLADDAPPFVSLAPDWLCEVLSPSTERYDRGKKMRIYHREGVNHLWLVNPMQRFVDVFQRDERGWTLLETVEGDGPLRVSPFERVEIPLELLWSHRPTP
jgi:Uma2 family endonuclease